MVKQRPSELLSHEQECSCYWCWIWESYGYREQDFPGKPKVDNKQRCPSCNGTGDNACKGCDGTGVQKDWFYG